MSRNTRMMQCTPEAVFEVLGDGWLYPAWVVGASRMRQVDERWPAAGSELHHSFGVWPVLVNDRTVVERIDPGRSMVMRARGWPLGEARVTIDMKRRGDGTVVRIQEEATTGPARLVPPPLMDLLLSWRNAEVLHRLAYLAEGRSATPPEQTTADREMSDAGDGTTDAGGEAADAGGRASGDTKAPRS